MMDKARHITPHLNGAVPVLKGEHASQEQPEIRLKEVLREYVCDFLVL